MASILPEVSRVKPLAWITRCIAQGGFPTAAEAHSLRKAGITHLLNVGDAQESAGPLRIGQGVVDVIVAHALEERPRECCGILVGGEGRIIRGVRARNLAEEPTRFKLITSLLLAVTCPVLVAPAMNDRMWNHPAVKENIEILRKRGYKFVEPDSGFLACGTYAKGRLANPVQIVEEIVRCVS